ncbi:MULTISPECIES: TolC family protein [Methylophaga]|jgi:cobalt-zinc-cadmium efflux system outer membrane protein|uniref:TolC family protein n=2 Tax=Methylophaga TaxID=40222 RepID=A0ABN0TK44_9GAMM|nr:MULTISPECIES: TolC family protein [unclassified Methylophaga]|tara:strand:+ start:1475 stop:2773 length:1299 start_codon:yes stop_codon:yes gene_type:complete
MKKQYDCVQSSRKPVVLALVCYLLPAAMAPLTYADAGQQEKALGLREAMQQTLQQHPSLQVFPLRQQGLEAQKKTANLKPAYVVGAEVENVAGTGELSGIKALETRVTLSSVLELGDKRQSRVDLVEQQSDVVRVDRKVKALDLLGQVTRRFINVLNSQERVKLAEVGLELAQTTLKEVNRRVSAAVAPKADLGRAEASVQQAELTLLAEQRQFESHRMALANLWGSYQPAFDEVSGSLYSFNEAMPFDALFSKAQQNPQIEMFAAEARVRDAEVRLARTQQVADLTWSVGIRRDEGIDDSALVAGISMPLFSQERAQSRIEAALAARNEVTYRRQDVLLQLHTELYRAYSGRSQAITSIQRLQQHIIPKLNTSLEQTRVGYQRGLYSYLDLLTVRQDLLNARRAVIEAATAALKYEAEIEQLTAEPLAKTE